MGGGGGLPKDQEDRVEGRGGGGAGKTTNLNVF